VRLTELLPALLTELERAAHAHAVARPYELVDLVRLAQQLADHGAVVERPPAATIDLPHALLAPVEMRDAIAGTQPGLPLARSLGHERGVHLRALDSRSLEDVLRAALRIAFAYDRSVRARPRCERCDARLQHRDVGEPSERIRHGHRAHVIDDDVVTLVLREHA